MVSGWWSGNPDTAALHARMLRALAAPSQETETREATAPGARKP
jgi:hypothetical protein